MFQGLIFFEVSVSQERLELDDDVTLLRNFARGLCSTRRPNCNPPCGVAQGDLLIPVIGSGAVKSKVAWNEREEKGQAVNERKATIDVIVRCHTAGALLRQTAENNCPYHRVVGF